MPVLFLYGTSLPGQPDHPWVADLPATPATVHGVLWRAPNGRPALRPDSDGRSIKGVLVDVDPGRMSVLDLLETSGNAPFARVRVRASSHLRSVDAEAWVLTARDPKKLGYRQLKTTDWLRVSP